MRAKRRLPADEDMWKNFHVSARNRPSDVPRNARGWRDVIAALVGFAGPASRPLRCDPAQRRPRKSNAFVRRSRSPFAYSEGPDLKLMLRH